jgi:hypothetical protein
MTSEFFMKIGLGVPTAPFSNQPMRVGAAGTPRPAFVKDLWTKRVLLLAVGLCLAFSFGAIFETTARADTVTNCTQQDLLRALATDNTATFEDDCDISITNSIPIATDTTIDASGFTVSITAAGTNNFSLFLIQNGATLTMNGITLMGGHSTNGGGGIYIESGAEADLTECILAGNAALGTNGFNGTNGNDSVGTGGSGTAGRKGSAAYGGAIYNVGTLRLDTCKFFTNNATGGNGGDGGAGGSGGYQGGNGASGGSGAAAFGGAIYSIGDLTASDSTFDGNIVQGGDAGAGGAAGSGPFAGLAGSGGTGAAASGAAIYAAGGDPDMPNIQRCTFSNNRGMGGNSAAGGTLSNGNGSAGAKGGNSIGGGLCIVNSTNTLINCTFFNNIVAGGSGGNGGNGSYNAGNGGSGGDATGGGLYSNGHVTITNCTFANGGAIGGTNGLAGTGAFAGSNGSRGASHGGNLARAAGTFILANSIVATNSGGANGYGAMTDGGYNISSDGSISLLSGRHSKKKTNPYIGTLSDNGGPTLTVPLVKPQNGVTSPAIDAILGTPDINFPSTDQRGQSRPQQVYSDLADLADIGAYEAGPPFISLTNQIAALGSDVTFTAYAGGDGPFTYQWQWFGTNLPGVVSSIFVVQDVSPTNSGPYDVIVSNIYGSAVSPSVFVNFEPFIIVQPTSQTVQQGSPSFFSVTNTGDSPLTYRWYFQGTNGGGTNLLRTTSINNNAPTNGDTFIVSSNTLPSNLGNYFVSISNRFLAVTSSIATLAFGAGPVIISPPASLSTNAGSSVTFSVTASGDPTPAYQWQFNGTNLGGANGTSFTLSNVQTNNNGDYTVVVSNAVGMVTSSPPAHLSVSVSSGPATIIVQPVSQIVVAGSNATFSVVAEGTPPLTYQWIFNGVNIPGATLSTYTRVHAQPSHAGNYEVFVSNGFGSDESDPNVTLRVLNAPVSANGLKFSSNAFSFTFGSQTGFIYAVQFKNTLGDSNWTTLLTTNGTGSPISVKDSAAAGSSRFYRVQVR